VSDTGAPVAIVTGASRGIGRAIAQQLAGDGHAVVLVARSRDALDTLAASLPRESLLLDADLRERDAAQRVVDAALQRFGRIDVLVNNAGATPRGDFLAFSDADWDDGFALKFFGAMRLCRAAWPALVASQGCIVNIAGIGGRTGNAEFAIGGSVNAALLNLTKGLADRGVRDGVRVNAVNPSSIATERTQLRIDRLAAERGIAPQQAADELARQLRVARFGTPQEIARVVAFLASDAASYMQGAIVDVDGGQTRTL
jgi:NAD(P)-dependent dehydrogenase (short-subunit alcohol dehydrogenase family)